jgi:biopolymer transport protein ExbB
MANNLYDVVMHDPLVMIPMMGLSVMTISCAVERAFFWRKLLAEEKQIAHSVMEIARYSLTDAREVAERGSDVSIGRLLVAPLRLNRPTPESFRLALETTAEEEFVKMRKGDKLLETVVGVAPLLGLLGTVFGLMSTFTKLNIGGGSGEGGGGLGKAAEGIGAALTATASGMMIAIVALLLLRTFLSLQTQQEEFFAKVAGDLELIYRQCWYEPAVEGNERLVRGDRLDDYRDNSVANLATTNYNAGSNSSIEPISPEAFFAK